MADPVIRSIGLCAGVGMLDLGLSAGLEYLGIRHRTIAYCEREAYAASQLLALMESECLDAAPIWPDLTTFPAGEFRGVVDCITAGFPCQPHSVAGKREGTDDARWIWPAIVGIIRDSGAWLVVLENVRGLLSSGGMAPVLADLADLGFHVEWTVLSAGEVGASHRRERVFIVGVKVGYAGYLSGVAEHWQQPESASGRVGQSSNGNDVAHGASRRFRELRQSSGCDGQPDGINAQLDDAGVADARHKSGRQEQQVAVCRCGSAPDDCVCGAGLANPSSGLIPQSRRGAQGRDGAGSAVAVLEYAAGVRLARHNADETGGYVAGGGIGTFARKSRTGQRHKHRTPRT